MSGSARPKLSQPCPCGSGKKYRDCCALKQDRRRRAGRRARKAAVWLGAVAAAVLIVYGVSELSGVAYDETDIAVVDFADLSRSQKRAALRAANEARCPCGCKMNVAQCMSIDSTCPLRTENIDKIRTMVAEQRQTADESSR